ncbi:response regulator transcription factor [Hydrogenimonas thermophila]|uniref:DNA-binding response regulator, OmpR family, contains REC and winged-helix (WHTH) domain n=1 Tax=Hydrogenimonas thermophila TaxID=223786 RepID=A0A1I5UE19_9BACT|nr:response regulator transcription factor [Hydrogenimonas thermophila]SFP93464.1 DNA-binding response regulator, OmpR family, contains REC and winged-helix (wHTH) domain [Hydrogenimonas thermophila]
MNNSILLIEDDKQMQELICDYLESFGYKIESFTDPKEAINQFLKAPNNFDVIILDLMLPGMDGFDVCKTIKEHSDIPIIISSARGDIGNKIYGFELGVDDYLAKPYEPRELVLRIEAVLRRLNKSNKTKISDFIIDTTNREVLLDNYPIDLTKVEFEIFFHLLKNQNRVVSREQIINASSLPIDTKNRTVDMHISNIRHKIGDDPKNPKYIKSIWGIGYKFIGK